ncbi:unnamed protein product [Paramecium octaurelia]|uniref:Uncharacterized protein n=1 Tax=Paramecium octaurelia TaxID=43137 RepID=A0A8S1XKD8_PAROT|nr:unnamed protein product [Paramecium octaurelia]
MLNTPWLSQHYILIYCQGNNCLERDVLAERLNELSMLDHIWTKQHKFEHIQQDDLKHGNIKIPQELELRSNASPLVEQK